jgi:predicted short-subunit dehydrogenase-like oxidoreductase (DUF2520 family)
VNATGRLAVGVIGAGGVGVAMAQALAGAGHLLLGITAISQESRDRVEAQLPEVEVLTIGEVLARAELVILAIPETELEAVIGGFSEEHLWKAGQLVAHTSAAHGYTVLSSAAQQGVIPLAIHPSMRFTGTSVDVARLRESFCAVSAPKVALPIAQALVIEMGAEPVVITEEQRAAYAEAFEVATNFSAMVVNQAIGLLEDAGIENARGIIAPSVRSAVERALDDGHTPIDTAKLFDGKAGNGETDRGSLGGSDFEPGDDR